MDKLKPLLLSLLSTSAYISVPGGVAYKGTAVWSEYVLKACMERNKDLAKSIKAWNTRPQIEKEG